MSSTLKAIGLVLLLTNDLNAGLGTWLTPPPEERSDPYAAERERIAQHELKEQLEQARSEAAASEAREQIESWQNFVPEDPWRVLDSVATFATGDGWVKFSGKIIQATPIGIRVVGNFRTLDHPFKYRTFRGEFIVANFPYCTTNEGQIIFPESLTDLTAKEAGRCTLGGSNTLRKLDYGVVIIPPPPAPESVESVTKAAEAQMETDAKVLKWNQEQADKGSSYSQFRMGKSYLTGDGVAKNLVKARDYLSKAAAQGNEDAAAELRKLPSK